MQSTINVFYSYADEDERLQKKLETHLTVFRQEGSIATWNKRNVSAGTEWMIQIDEHIERAQIILLLVSAHFLASQYCYSIELQRALQKHEAHEACVIPIILRPVDWEKSPLGKLQVLPRGGKPVTGRGWKNMDEAFAHIAHDLRSVLTQVKGYSDLKSRLAPDISLSLKPIPTPGTLAQLKAYAELKSQIPRLSITPQAPTFPPKVLIMDDDVLIGNFLLLLLRDAGIESQYVIDGEQGLIAAQKLHPELILLDLAMPVIEGFEVIRRLRASLDTRNTPIIVLTARDNDAYRTKAFELGINDYMLKPFKSEELLARVKVQLSKPLTP
jgi:CheY-like chemotaxis protein